MLEIGKRPDAYKQFTNIAAHMQKNDGSVPQTLSMGFMIQHDKKIALL